jgi:alkylated DNA repair dioxygenase AlkB
MEKRKSCYFSSLRNADSTLREYYYSGKKNIPNEFTDELNELKASIEAATCFKFNACLVNLYETGKNVIGFHSDKERSLCEHSGIASISLGAERWFDIRGMDNKPYEGIEKSVRVKHGSMIIMAGTM